LIYSNTLTLQQTLNGTNFQDMSEMTISPDGTRLLLLNSRGGIVYNLETSEIIRKKNETYIIFNRRQTDFDYVYPRYEEHDDKYEVEGEVLDSEEIDNILWRNTDYIQEFFAT
jgi:hypothetical protein